MTTAQIVSQFQAGRYLAALGVMSAEAAPHAIGGFYAHLSDGRGRVHSDKLQSRAWGTLASLAER